MRLWLGRTCVVSLLGPALLLRVFCAGALLEVEGAGWAGAGASATSTSSHTDSTTASGVGKKGRERVSEQAEMGSGEGCVGLAGGRKERGVSSK